MPVGCSVMHPVGQKVSPSQGAVIRNETRWCMKAVRGTFLMRLRIDSLSLGYC